MLREGRHSDATSRPHVRRLGSEAAGSGATSLCLGPFRLRPVAHTHADIRASLWQRGRRCQAAVLGLSCSALRPSYLRGQLPLRSEAWREGTERDGKGAGPSASSLVARKRCPARMSSSGWFLCRVAPGLVVGEPHDHLQVQAEGTPRDISSRL